MIFFLDLYIFNLRLFKWDLNFFFIFFYNQKIMKNKYNCIKKCNIIKKYN